MGLIWHMDYLRSMGIFNFERKCEEMITLVEFQEIFSSEDFMVLDATKLF